MNINKLIAKPIDQQAFKAYGQLIHAKDHDTALVVNEKRGLRYPGLVHFENLRPETAKAQASIFKMQAFPLPYNLVLMERHKFSNQLFIPINVKRYLIIVATGKEKIEEESLKSFIVDGNYGINYASGTWHAPIIALDQTSQFFSYIFENNSSEDTEEQAVAKRKVRI